MENKKLNDLYDAVAEELLAKIQSGEAKPADLAVAVRFLKDNDITALPVNDNALQQLMESMPFPSEKDIAKGKTSFDC
tara:strand:+ start:396 stop:629 length:234 start_codon:yes stop_codon:yes gene_type:complete